MTQEVAIPTDYVTRTVIPMSLDPYTLIFKMHLFLMFFEGFFFVFTKPL